MLRLFHDLIHRHQRSLRWLAVLMILAAAYFFIRTFPFDLATSTLEMRLAALGPWSVIVFGVIYVGGTVLLLPAWPLSLAAGAVFGLFWGTVFVSLYSTLGVAVMFLLARHLLRDKLASVVRRDPRFRALDRAVGEAGWKIVVLVRLSPVIPFNLQNYLYGLTSLRFWPCVVASWLAMLPATFMYVYAGYLGRASLASAASAETPVGWIQWGLRILGFFATLLVTIYLTHRARRALHDQTHLDDVGEVPPKPGPLEEAPIVSVLHRQGFPWGTIISLALAVVLLVVAISSHARRDQIHRVLKQWFERQAAGATVELPAETNRSMSSLTQFDSSLKCSMIRRFGGVTRLGRPTVSAQQRTQQQGDGQGGDNRHNHDGRKHVGDDRRGRIGAGEESGAQGNSRHHQLHSAASTHRRPQRKRLARR